MIDFSSKKVSLVLGSGGARGLTQIGVIKVLKQKGAEVNEIIGSSIGSLIGGIYAQDQIEIFEDWIITLTRRDVFSLIDFTMSNFGLVKGWKVLDKMKEIIPDILIEDMPIDFSAVVTDLIDEKEILIQTGSFYAAVRASIAIPGVFKPISYEDKIIVDGGVLNPLPISHVKNREENLVIAVNLDGSPILNGHLQPKLVSLVQQSYGAMRRQLSRMAIQFYKPDIVINVPDNISGTFQFEKAKDLIQIGMEMAQKEIGN